MATPLGKPSDKAVRPESPGPVRVAVKCGVCVVALLGFVVPATTFLARLASIRILPATQSVEELIRGSIMQRLKNIGGRIGHFGIVAAFAAFCAFPFYWMLITTFKQTNDLINVKNNPFLYNSPPTLENLRTLFIDTQYAQWLLNTLGVGVLVVLITLLLAVPAGYSLARLTGRWGQQLAIGIFLTYLIPPTILFIPFSRIISDLGLQDSLWSLVLVYPSFTVPFCTWLMMGFFKTVPRDIEEAAMIDGLTRFGAFLKVVVPISSAGILTVIIFTLTLVMQEFVYALTFITSSSQLTVSIGVPTFLVRGDVYFWGSLMGACLIVSIPIAILYNFFVDRFVAGFTVGAVK